MADGLRKIAKALYKRGSGEEKREVVELLTKLDFVLGEEVSVQEFKKKECVESPNEELLKELCSKRDGGLDFYDVLVVFYHSKNAITILRCDACRLLIFGPSFSCSDCFSSNCSSHTLCCDCYGGGEAIHHDHPAARFFHDQHLLDLRLNPAKVSSQGQNRKERESGISSIARAYYERSSDDEKKEAREFFGTIDANGDGKISLTELKNVLNMKTSEIEKLFQEVDSDGDGALNFVEGLALYYSCKRIIGYVTCNGCEKPLMGPYFSCAVCVHRYPHTFDLCCDCHRCGKVEHEHPYSDFLYNQLLLSRLMRIQAKGGMEEVREIAKLYLEAATPSVAKAAKEFFDSMDSNGDGKVDVEEFMSFMSEKEECQQQRRNSQWFKFLDADGSGSLDFSEAMMLFYVIKSGRPDCDGCSAFIPGTFFACLRCSYTLCRPCYKSKDHPHAHGDGCTAPLLDNYSLFHNMRQSNRLQLGDEPPSSSRPTVELPLPSKMSKREMTFKALQVAIGVTGFALQASACVIL